MGRPRVLLADDHPAVADELRKLLEAEFDVVAVVTDGNAFSAPRTWCTRTSWSPTS